MDMAPWPQEIVVKPMEEMITNTTTSPNTNNTKPQPSTSLERKVRPQKDQALNCPRCNSTNTKFCYYNNYSLTQPRYFCKGCRRYWTAGGSLRNIPVGGGSRKNKRPSSSSISSSSATSKIKLSDHHHHPHQIQHHHHQQHHVMPTNPNSKIHEQGQGHDLNLGFPSTLSEFMQLPNMEPPNTSNNNTSHLSALELLTGLTSSSRGLMTPFMQMQIPDPNSVFPSGFSLQGDHHFKPSLNFSLDGIGNGGGMHHPHGVQESGGRILFPFEDLKSTTTTATTTTTTADHHHDHHQQHQHQNQNQNQHHHGDQQITRDHHHQQQQQGDSTGYWTGMLGGGGGSSW